MTSIAQVLAVARKRWPKARIVENRRAPSAEQRATGLARRREINARQGEIRRRKDELKAWSRELTSAARFVVDTEGDRTALPQLEAALLKAEEYESLSEEHRDLEKESRSLDTHSYRWRCYSGVIVGGLAAVVEADADTLDELLAQLESAT